jgi:hypothetical protein
MVFLLNNNNLEDKNNKKNLILIIYQKIIKNLFHFINNLKFNKISKENLFLVKLYINWIFRSLSIKIIRKLKN